MALRAALATIEISVVLLCVSGVSHARSRAIPKPTDVKNIYLSSDLIIASTAPANKAHLSWRPTPKTNPLSRWFWSYGKAQLVPEKVIYPYEKKPFYVQFFYYEIDCYNDKPMRWVLFLKRLADGTWRPLACISYSMDGKRLVSEGVRNPSYEYYIGNKYIRNMNHQEFVHSLAQIVKSKKKSD